MCVYSEIILIREKPRGFHSAIQGRRTFSTLLFTQNLSNDTSLFIRLHFVLLTFFESFEAVSQVWNKLKLEFG